MKKFHKNLLEGYVFDTFDTAFVSIASGIICAIVVMLSLICLVNTQDISAQNPGVFYFRTIGMTWIYGVTFASSLIAIINMFILIDRYDAWVYLYRDKQRIEKVQTDCRAAYEWEAIKDGTAAEIKMKATYWMFVVLSFAIIPISILMLVIYMFIGIYKLIANGIDSIARKTIYKPKSPERDMIQKFNNLLDD